MTDPVAGASPPASQGLTDEELAKLVEQEAKSEGITVTGSLFSPDAFPYRLAAHYYAREPEGLGLNGFAAVSAGREGRGRTLRPRAGRPGPADRRTAPCSP